MGEIEDRVTRAGREQSAAASPAEAERETRTLNSLARLLEKLAALDTAKPASGETGEGAETTETELDAQRHRREIADRLARLLEGEQD